MKLHKILLRHCGPKSSIEVTHSYVLANDEPTILNTIDDSYCYKNWKSCSKDDDLFEIRDENYNVLGTETLLERMLRLRGEFNDENADYSDAYYGIKHWGWDEGVEISEEDAAVLLRLGIAEDWRS